MSVLQIILIVLILIVVVAAAVGFMLAQEAKKKKRLVHVIKGGTVSAVDRKKEEQSLQNKRRAEIAKKLKETKDDEVKDGKKQKATIPMLIAQAGLKMSTKQFWLMSLAFMFVLLILAKLSGQNIVVVGLAGVIGFFGIPRFFLRWKAKRRQKKFLEEFPDALEAVVRLLKAGMPVSEAISMISKEYDGPVGEEMSIVYDKQKIGVPLHEAATEATRRMPLPEMQMFATGLSIQAQTGSSLSEVLLNLAGVIRARFRLKRKVKALSSEAIASASIIGALPNIVAFGLWFINPEYINILFTNSLGKMLVAGAIIWMCLGILAMKIMINFKV